MLSNHKLKRVDYVWLIDTVKFGIGFESFKVAKVEKIEMGWAHSFKLLELLESQLGLG